MLIREPEASLHEAGAWPAQAWNWARQNVLVTFGIIGTALTIFQGLETFLKLSRLAGWVVEHWREVLVVPWAWLGSLTGIEVYPDDAVLFSMIVFMSVFILRARSRQQPNYSAIFKLVSILWFRLFLSMAGFIIIMQIKLPSVISLPFLLFGSICTAYIYSLLLTRQWKMFLVVPLIMIASALIASILTIPLLLVFDLHLNDEYISLVNNLNGFTFCVLLIYFIDIRPTINGAKTDRQRTIELIWLDGARNALWATMLILSFICLNWIGHYAPDISMWLDETTSLSP